MEALPATEKRLEEIQSCQETDPGSGEAGWPNHGKRLSKDIRPYFTVRAEISIMEGILMRGCRMIIPSSMRPDILRKIHTGHHGIIKCREMARETVCMVARIVQGFGQSSKRLRDML